MDSRGTFNSYNDSNSDRVLDLSTKSNIRSGDLPDFRIQIPDLDNDTNEIFYGDIKQNAGFSQTHSNSELNRMPRPDTPHPITTTNDILLKPFATTLAKQHLNHSSTSTTKSYPEKPTEIPRKERRRASALSNPHKNEYLNDDQINNNKKKVSFAPDVACYDRENKPARLSSSKRALAPFGDRRLGFFIPPAAELIRYPSPIPNKLPGIIADSPERKLDENDYVAFTHIWRTPNMDSRKNDDKCIVRLKRIHNLMSDLTDSHSLYKYIPESIKAKFLQEEILPRYVMALDLVLTESLLGVAIAMINTIRESACFLQEMFYGEFFDENNLPTYLPSVQDCGPTFVDKVSPVIFTLNRICGNHSRSDSSYMSKETACTKLMLEVMALTALPPKSVMFRCILGIIPTTASNCIKYLSQVQHESLMGWVNNSVMRREYMICLTKLGLADEFGAKAVLPALSLATLYAMNAKNKSKKEKPRNRSARTATLGNSIPYTRYGNS